MQLICQMHVEIHKHESIAWKYPESKQQEILKYPIK